MQAPAARHGRKGDRVMANIAAVDPLAQKGVPGTRPYPPSWVDLFTEWVRRLPGSAALFYLGLALILVLLEVMVKWLDGTYQQENAWIGVPYHLVLMVTGVYYLATIHQLDDTAAAALARFRPVLQVDEAQYTRLRYQITTLPAGWTWLASLAGALGGVIIAVISAPEDYARLHLTTSPAATVLEIGAWIFMWFAGGAFAYHTVHQLWMVNIIYTGYTRINLFELGPLYAFSLLTARTALRLSLNVYVLWIAADRAWETPQGAIPGLAFLLLAATAFIWPLIGVHRLLQNAKEQEQGALAQRMEAAIGELQRRLTAGELAGMDQFRHGMESLVLAQRELDKIPTWPWQPGTVRNLATAILLPIILWLITRVLERVLAF
jgi:hypothetical protein